MWSGERPSRPDFIIGGAARSGTTWLYEVLDSHPTISMAKPRRPEPKFFLKDDLFRRGYQHYYDTWFQEQDRPGITLGEKSTNYLEGPAVAQRMHDTLPAVRLVFVLRNPVERAYSNYLWSRKNGLESQSFWYAIQNEESRTCSLSPDLRPIEPFSYIKRGKYAKMLARFYQRFPVTQIKVVSFEEMVCPDRQQACLAELCRFLDVNDRAPLQIPTSPVNQANDGEHSMADRERAYLRDVFDAEQDDLAELIGRRFDWR